MTVYVKPSHGRQKDDFLALCMVRGGVCVPIAGEVEESRDDAVQTGIRDLRDHLEDLMEHVQGEVARIQANLVRLLDRVQRSDQVRIAGVWQSPGEDALVMPRRGGTARFLGRADRKPIEIKASLYVALHAALDLRGSSDDPAEVMLEYARNDPAELLARVVAKNPDRCEEAARFVVQVFEAQREGPEARPLSGRRRPIIRTRVHETAIPLSLGRRVELAVPSPVS